MLIPKPQCEHFLVPFSQIDLKFSPNTTLEKLGICGRDLANLVYSDNYIEKSTIPIRLVSAGRCVYIDIIIAYHDGLVL